VRQFVVLYEILNQYKDSEDGPDPRIMEVVEGFKFDFQKDEPKIKLRTMPCPMCGDVAVVEVLEAEAAKYKRGEHIQNAFPTMSADDRERFITGYDKKCWDKIFGEED
jgi:hypothetical protein